jgi:endonuclease-3 related protein
MPRDKKTAKKLSQIFQRLFNFFGPQHWWPGETPFEVCIGAILTQNTNWQNVERAINNLKKEKLLNPIKLHRLPQRKLAQLIRPSGYFNIKAGRLKEFLNFLFDEFDGDLNRMSQEETKGLRDKLLEVKGIGPETCDSILLYAGNKAVFVIDAYTKRILLRHKLIKEGATYQDMQKLFVWNLPKSVKLYNEYHALLVRLGKEICLKKKPKCQVCPLFRLDGLARFAR